MRAALIAGVVIVLSMALSAQDDPRLPAGSANALVASKCLGCHGSDLIRQQRLSRASWVRELDKMIRWGAAMSESERDRAADYLAENFGAAPPAPPFTSEGLAVFERHCLGCHGADLVEQQRLSGPAWAREVDKMIGWGATPGASEKDVLVDYLAGRFGPRK